MMTARISMLLKSRASPEMLPFSLCNKKRLAIWHMNSPLFPTTLSIPSYDIGKLVGLRTYQHALVKIALIRKTGVKFALAGPSPYWDAELLILSIHNVCNEFKGL